MSSLQHWQVWKSPWIWLIVVVILSLPLLADFNARLAYSRQLATEETSLSRQINDEQKRQTALLDLREYVKSNAYVERWARGMQLALPGEVPVVPAPMDLSRAPHSNTTNSPVVNDISSEWWTLMLGATP
jgi:hypothetical protein